MSTEAGDAAAAARMRQARQDRRVAVGDRRQAPARERAEATPPRLPPNEVHRCKVCGTLWRRWRDGAKWDASWSLIDPSDRHQPGKCCDNGTMGEQIEQLYPPAAPSVADSGQGALLPLVEKLADYLGRCTLYGPADATREAMENLLRAVRQQEEG